MIEYSHPVSANDAALLSALTVILGSLGGSSLFLVLNLVELSQHVQGSVALRLLNDYFQALENLVHVWLLVVADVMICLVFKSPHVIILSGLLYPVDALLLILLDFVAHTLKGEAAEDEASVIVISADYN